MSAMLCERKKIKFNRVVHYAVKDIDTNLIEDPIMQEQDRKIEKEHILERIKRIEIIKAVGKELKTNYKFKNKERGCCKTNKLVL